MEDKLNKEEITKLKEAIASELVNPPTIGLIGTSGVGKSSTINTMFKTRLPVSHTKACTKKLESIDMNVNFETDLIRNNSNVALKVYDAPGLGEDIQIDPHYIEMYQNYLPQCDIVIWVLDASNRATALDQSYIKLLLNYSERFVFLPE